MTLRVPTICIAIYLALSCFTARADVLIAAASNIMAPLDEIIVQFEEQTGEQVKVSYGASGVLSRQIMRGAPFEILLSADRWHIEILSSQGVGILADEDYATGRLALFLNGASPISQDISILTSFYELGKIRKFAIANPEHAPYGRAARDVLVKLGIWDLAKTTLVMGENANQAARFAASASTDGGLVPHSLTVLPESVFSGNTVIVPADMHAPLHQRMALLDRASSAARLFYDVLRSNNARSVFLRYGYAVPEQQG